MMLQLNEMDDHVRLADQLAQEVGPVILINTFRVAPEDADALQAAWAADAAYLKQQPGFISGRGYLTTGRLRRVTCRPAGGPGPFGGQLGSGHAHALADPASRLPRDDPR
jgi:Antibiotic biosynthesis monooxygenase